MGLIAGTTFLAGAVLGVRFKVLVLFPAMLVAIAAVGIVAIDNRVDLWSFVLMVTIAVVSIQVGYVVGAIATAALGDESREGQNLPSQSRGVVTRSRH
jgi:hypothetical protein